MTQTPKTNNEYLFNEYLISSVGGGLKGSTDPVHGIYADNLIVVPILFRISNFYSGIKNEINKVFNSSLLEQKSYPEY